MSLKKSTMAVKKSKFSKDSANVTAAITPLESEKNRKESVIENKENDTQVARHKPKVNGTAKVNGISKEPEVQSTKRSSLHQTKALAGVLSRFPIVFTKDSK
jgi:hypothetical protein